MNTLIYLHTKFYIRSYKNSSVTALELKGKYKFRAASMMLFNIVQNNCRNKSRMFSDCVFSHKILGS